MPAGQFAGLRQVVEEAEVSSTIDEGREKYPRLDEAWQGLTWLLARSADEMGRLSRDGKFRLYVQPGDAAFNVPEIWIIFKADAAEITVLAVHLSEAEDDLGEA